MGWGALGIPFFTGRAKAENAANCFCDYPCLIRVHNADGELPRLPTRLQFCARACLHGRKPFLVFASTEILLVSRFINPIPLATVMAM